MPQSRLPIRSVTAVALIAGAIAHPSSSYAQGLAERFGPQVPLRIVSLDLTQAPAVAAARPAAVARPSWRTSFGSEIRNEPRRKLPALDIEADVVLLQGVTSIREARRFFPARAWKLVLSREFIGRGDPAMSSAARVETDRPVTAVAVRFQRGVRATGQDHLPARSDRGFGTTAVRLLVEDRMIWLVSASFETACLAQPAGCEAETALRVWREERREDGEVTIAGGNIRPLDATAGPCSQQWIDSDPVRPGAPTIDAERVRTDSTGCISRLEIAR